MSETAASSQTRIAVVIVNYRTPDLVLALLETLEPVREQFPETMILIVDGGSGDNSADKIGVAITDLRWREWVELLDLGINGGFGWANNQAILRLARKQPRIEYFYLINPDTMIEPDAVSKLVEVFEQVPNAGAVGSLLLDQDGAPTGSVFRFPSIGREFLRGIQVGAIGRALGIKPIAITCDHVTEADWVTGASVMLRRDALERCGLFDTGFFLYFEEVELMWRMKKAGFIILHQPASRVYHIGGAATGMTYNRKDIKTDPPLPDYWYASRRRMFVLTGGKTTFALANMAWLAGRSILKSLQILGLKRGARMNANEFSTIIANGIFARATELPRHERLADCPGHIPAWLQASGEAQPARPLQ